MRRANIIGIAAVAVVAAVFLAGNIGSDDEPKVERWTYMSREGHRYHVECDDDTSCTDGVPDPVLHIENARTCEGIQSQLDLWRSFDDDQSGEVRNNSDAFAAVAEDELNESGCL